MNRIKPHLAFLCLLLAIIASNVTWIWLDHSPALWDMAGHSERAAEVAQLIASGQFGQVLTTPGIYPPFTYAVTAVGFLVFGMHRDVPQYTLLVWIVLFAVSLYSIGLHLFKRRDVATLAVFFCFAFPLFAHFTRIYDLDFPLTATVTATTAALLRTDKFTHKRWTIIFGALVGSALLTKWTAFIFLLAPTMCVLVPTLRTRYEHRKKFHNLALALTAVLVIAAPWYVLHAREVLATASATRNNIFSVPFENLFSIGNTLFYANWVVRGITWPIAFVTLAGVIGTFFRRKFADGFLLLWIVAPYVVLTFALYSKESRYLLPVFPALALLLAALIMHMKPNKQLAFTVSAGGVALVFWLQTSWNVRMIPESTFNSLRLQNTYGLQTITGDKPYFGFTYPTEYGGTVVDAVSALAYDLDPADYNGTVRVTVVPNSIFLTAQQVQYNARLIGLDAPNKTFTVDYSISSAIRNNGWESRIGESDYLITKTGDQGPSIWGPALPKVAAAEKRQDTDTFSQFTLIGSWEFAGTEEQPQTLRLYKHR